MVSADAKSGRRCSVTTVKKNEPPGMNARRYLILLRRVTLR